MRSVRVAVVFTILALATRGATAASTPAALLCVRQAQTDLKACQTLARQTVDQCSLTYFAAVPPCFGANAPCASDCITTQTGCETDPKDRQTACAATCDQRAKNFQSTCKGRPTNAAQACSLAAKVKSLKCKQKCARAAVVPLERCGLDFKSCLTRCASLGGS